MKKLLFLLPFLALYSYGQNVPDATIKNNTNTLIRNATTVTRANHSLINDELTDSKMSRIENNQVSGTNTYSATVSWINAYTKGLTVPVFFTNANSGASTINFNSLGTVPLKKNGITSLIPLDIISNVPYVLVYDGTNFQLTGSGGVGSLSATAPLSYNSTTSTLSFPTWPSNSTGTLQNDGSGNLSWVTMSSSFSGLSDVNVSSLLNNQFLHYQTSDNKWHNFSFVPGTDYAPATSGTSILKGNGSGGFSNASGGTDYEMPSNKINIFPSSPGSTQYLSTSGVLNSFDGDDGTSTITLTDGSTVTWDWKSKPRGEVKWYIGAGATARTLTITNHIVAAIGRIKVQKNDAADVVISFTHSIGSPATFLSPKYGDVTTAGITLTGAAFSYFELEFSYDKGFNAMFVSVKGNPATSVANALTVDNSSLQLSSGTTFDGSAARTISVKALGITNAMLAGSIAYSKLSLTGSILNADLAGSIDATKINTGVVSNAEFNYLDGVTSAVQTQIDSKQATITFGTGVLTALGVNVGSAGAPVLFNGAGGTPSSLTGTNITGTASGLTAGNVTTNANLTGPITSVGNATSIASQTGTGTTFVMSAAPTFTGTPILSTPSMTSFAISGTGGNGYGEFIAQSSNTSAPSSSGFRIFAGSTGSFNWARKNGSDTYIRTFDATLTADRTFTLQDASSTLAMYSNNLSVFASTTSAQLASVLSDETGTGAVVFAGSPAFTGTPTYGTLSYSDTDIAFSFQKSVNSYFQIPIQNTNSGATASTDIIISSDNGTATTHYLDLGKNSSGFTGSGSLNVAGYSYLTSTTDDLVIGTTTNNALRFLVNSGTTDALSISGAGLFTFTAPINGNTFTSTWTATANNQFMGRFTGTATTENVASDVIIGYQFDPNFTRNAGNPATQTAYSVYIKQPTISNNITTTASLYIEGGTTSSTAPLRIGNSAFANSAFLYQPSNSNLIIDAASGNGGIGLNGGNIIGGTTLTFATSTGILGFPELRGKVNSGGTSLTLTGNINSPSSGTSVGVSIGGTSNAQTTATTKFFSFDAATINLNANATNVTIYGIDYNPTLNNTIGLGTHYGLLVRPIATLSGFGVTTPTARLELGGAMSSASWTTTGIQMAFDAATYTDTGTAGTRSTGVAVGIAQPTYASTNAVTVTDASTFYIANNVAAGSNMTLTRSWSLWVDAGNSRFDGNLDFSQADATNFVFGTSTGTQIGTSTSQKIGHYGATPVVQPSAVTTPQGIATALTSLGLLATSTISNSVVASTFEKAETGTDANVLTYTTNASTDEYLLVNVSTDISALTGTSVVATVTWKDSNNATATSSVTLTGVTDGSVNVPINAFKNTNVVVSTSFTGASTAYNISAFITRLK